MNAAAMKDKLKTCRLQFIVQRCAFIVSR